MALSWCKVASNLDSHPKIRKAGRLGREVFLFALRRNAEPGNPVPGRLPGDELEPWYIADQLQMLESEAVTGVTAAVTAGLLALDGESYVIVGFDPEWGKSATAGKDRTAKWRENKKMENRVTGVTLPNVTQRHGDGGDALEEKRREEIREGSPPLALVSPPVKPDSKPKTPPHPDRARVIDAFHQRFKSAYGSKPTWRAKEVGQVNDLLKKHTGDVLVARINFMFDGRSKWPPPPYSLDAFVSNLDRFVEVAEPEQATPIRKVKTL